MVTEAPKIIALASDTHHNFSKVTQHTLTLIKGVGVKGDAHAGVTVKHRSRVAKDPSQPNLRQVHLIPAELFDDLARQGFHIKPGQLGENILTRGIDLLGLPTGARLTIGEAIIQITGLRNPCQQLNKFQDGLTQKLIFKNEDGGLTRRCGVMGIVVTGGEIQLGDKIEVTEPEGEFLPLECV